MNDFIDISDCSTQELRELLEESSSLKAFYKVRQARPVPGRPDAGHALREAEPAHADQLPGGHDRPGRPSDLRETRGHRRHRQARASQGYRPHPEPLRPGDHGPDVRAPDGGRSGPVRRYSRDQRADGLVASVPGDGGRADDPGALRTHRRDQDRLRGRREQRGPLAGLRRRQAEDEAGGRLAALLRVGRRDDRAGPTATRPIPCDRPAIPWQP